MQDWATETADAVRGNLTDVVSYIPTILAAVVIVLIGIIVAWAVKTVIVRALSFLKVKKYTDAVGLDKVIQKDVEVIELIGDLAKWIIILTFLVAAFDVLNLPGVQDILERVLLYVPNVVKAVVLVMIAFVVGDLAARVIRATATSIGVRASEVLADLARWAILLFGFFGALQELGLAVELINILWTGLVALVAIAGGVAFGLGGKDAASEAIVRIRRSFKEEK